MTECSQPLPSYETDNETVRSGGSNFPDICIAVPVLNGGARFAELCDMLALQDYPGAVDVLCIDSGSRDNSRNIVREHGFRIHEIMPGTYGHGRTRNLAFDLSSAPLVAFLTHDAVPENPNWLRTLVAALFQGDDIAGAYSRHIAHDNRNPFLSRDLDRHFAHRIPIARKSDYPDFDRSAATRQLCHFFSDNASVLRRDIWKKMPYPDVDFAEDQLWALQVLNAGLGIAYASDSIVRHSHDFGPWDTLRRSYDESRAFHRHFGYRLAHTPLSVSRSILGSLARDVHDAIHNGWVRTHTLTTARQLACDVTRPIGHWLGARKRAKRAEVSFLSRDNSLR